MCSRRRRRSRASWQRAQHRPRVTKRQLDAEWNVSIEEALEMEARAQARCMETNDFRRAYEAFAAKRTPEFQGD